MKDRALFVAVILSIAVLLGLSYAIYVGPTGYGTFGPQPASLLGIDVDATIYDGIITVDGVDAEPEWSPDFEDSPDSTVKVMMDSGTDQVGMFIVNDGGILNEYTIDFNMDMDDELKVTILDGGAIPTVECDSGGGWVPIANGDPCEEADEGVSWSDSPGTTEIVFDSSVPTDFSVTDEEITIINVYVIPPIYEDGGDAPDSTGNGGFFPMTAYPKGGPLGIQANYPTVWQAGPPFGPCHDSANIWAWLGTGISYENDADLLPDVDGITNINPLGDSPDQDFFDDGLVSISLPNCTQGNITFNVTYSASYTGYNLYFNAWVDFNRDGDWNDTLTCSVVGDTPEWIVQNMNVTQPGGAAVVTWHNDSWLSYNPDNSSKWIRIVLSPVPFLEPPAPGGWANASSGAGNGTCFEDGETEDYYWTKPSNTCLCINCTDCSAKLNNASCDIVQLIVPIMPPAFPGGNCINAPPGFFNKTFDCLGNPIIGVGVGTAIHLGMGNNYNTIQNCPITSFSNGINITNTANNNNIIGNQITFNINDGIYCHMGTNNNITFNLLQNNNNGIRFDEQCNFNTIYNNPIDTNFNDGIFFQQQCMDNVIDNNPIYYNVQNGIEFGTLCIGNDIINNEINSNTIAGILFKSQACDNNDILNNYIRFNIVIGLNITGGVDNIIYNNYFKNNGTGAMNVYDNTSNNTWNTTKTPGVNIIGGPNFGGNYWHDYTGLDTDDDGLGEQDYPILGSTNNDSLPLVLPVNCSCNSCDDCEAKLNDAACHYVNLTVDIINHSEPGGTCINMSGGFQNKTFDCQGHMIDGIDFGLGNYGIRMPGGTGRNTVENCIITDFDIGIRFTQSPHISIINNTLSSNNKGLWIDGLNFTYNNTIFGNNISSNSNIGIRIVNITSNCTIWNNYFSNNGKNVEDEGNNSWNVTYNCSGPANIVGGPCMGGNYWDDYTGTDDGTGTLPGIPNIAGDGIGDTDLPYNGSTSIHNGGDYLPLVPAVVCNCSTCSECETKLGNPACTYVNLTADIIGHNGTCIDWPADDKTFDCHGFAIDGDDVGFDEGIYMYNHHNNLIRNCTITGFREGVWIDTSFNNSIYKNEVSLNTLTGIYIEDSFDNNITDNWANSNNQTGILLYNSFNNEINRNKASMNNVEGISLYKNSSNNTLINNIAEFNTWHGIYIDNVSDNNELYKNAFCFNSYTDVEDDDANSGDNNSCHKVINWKDASAAQTCVYRCNPYCTQIGDYLRAGATWNFTNLTGALDLTFILDDSGSMSTIDIANEENASKDVVDMLRTGDRAAVVLFGTVGGTRLEQGFTSNKNDLKAAIDNLTGSQGATAIGTAINISYQNYLDNGNPASRWVTILMSDGGWNSGIDPLGAANVSTLGNMTIYTVGYGAFVDEITLKTIANTSRDNTGFGQYFYSPANGSALSGIFTGIFQNITTSNITNILRIDESLNEDRFLPYSNDTLEVSANVSSRLNGMPLPFINNTIYITPANVTASFRNSTAILFNFSMPFNATGNGTYYGSHIINLSMGTYTLDINAVAARLNNTLCPDYGTKSVEVTVGYPPRPKGPTPGGGGTRPTDTCQYVLEISAPSKLSMSGGEARSVEVTVTAVYCDVTNVRLGVDGEIPQSWVSITPAFYEKIEGGSSETFLVSIAAPITASTTAYLGEYTAIGGEANDTESFLLETFAPGKPAEKPPVEKIKEALVEFVQIVRYYKLSWLIGGILVGIGAVVLFSVYINQKPEEEGVEDTAKAI